MAIASVPPVDAPIAIIDVVAECVSKIRLLALFNTCEAVSGDVVKQGQILLAPGDKQMRVVKINGRYQVECRYGPRVTGISRIFLSA